jgi:poly(glycerol-phosphate) alpha-glucosyltransferase
MTVGTDEPRPGEPLLPDGRHLAVTWGIPDQFGGMTSALLHRSRAFLRRAGREVDIVTFDTRPDYAAVRARLTESSALVQGIRLRNLYEELRMTAPDAAPIEHRFLDPELDERSVTTAPDGSVLRVGRRDGRAVLVEHLRADGTIAVRDEREREREHPGQPQRLITACDPDGEPVRQWTSAGGCYTDWLDRVIGSDTAYAIVDSKSIAPFMARYRRPNVVTLHVLHNSHLFGTGRPYGMLRASRRTVMSRLERFDAAVFLTARQRDDVAALLSDSGNFAVVPNGIDAPPDVGQAAPASDADREPAAGVVIAGLTPRKRVSHAVDIVAGCRADGVPATLTIYGDGPDAPRLHARVADAGLDGAVTFAGHRPHAADAFAHASWMLLTSTSEGAPLVLVEAMARGCLPIAYDIPYGPADLIVDGLNGYLVPPGDRAAAVAAIGRIVALPSEERERMRHAARAAAARHDDGRIVAEWGRVERAAARRHHREQVPLEASISRYRLRFRRRRLLVSARLDGAPRGTSATITLRERESGAVLRKRVSARRRLSWTLDDRESEFLGTRHPLVGSIVVEHEGSRAEFMVGMRYPDRRSLARRILQRLSRPRDDPPG